MVLSTLCSVYFAFASAYLCNAQVSGKFATAVPTQVNTIMRPQAAGSIPKKVQVELDAVNAKEQSLWNDTERWTAFNSTSALFNVNLADIAVAESSTLGIGAYYASWNTHSIDWNGIDWINYAFALPQADFTLRVSSPDVLTTLIEQANANGKKLFLSIGGWGGSQFFSNAVVAENSPIFIQSILQTLETYPVHGLDFDWEYPNSQASGQDDTANFLKFLQDLKRSLPISIQLSAAVQVWPFADVNGIPIADASAFGAVLDKITIMSYDIFTSSSNPGPNAPLSSTCGGVGMYASVVASLETWSLAQFPREKIIMGMAEYGYMSETSASSLVHRAHTPDTKRRRDLTSNLVSDEGSSSGSITFNSMVTQGALFRESETCFSGDNGRVRQWDDCSSTPYLISSTLGRIISYDDPVSLKLKAQAVKQFGAGGVCSWTLQGDTPQGDLNYALRDGLQILN